MTPLPTVSVIFLVHNRRAELRTSLARTLHETDYPSDRLEVIVVDNASGDGSGDMVREEFPQVRLISRTENVGISGWNDGFAVAEGEYVLALDDDCFLPPDGLRRAVTEAREHAADLVSFTVESSHDPTYRFTDVYPTGLLSFWGCAVLMRREVVEQLGGYDPEIFVWANELEFMLRFFDHGFRHLHLPEVTAIHMKPPPGPFRDGLQAYRINAHHFSYVTAKLLHRRDAIAVFLALLAQNARDVVRYEPVALAALPDRFKGLAHGLRHRRPLRNPAVSRLYRKNFHSFAGPVQLKQSPAAYLHVLHRLARWLLRLEPPAPRNPGLRAHYFRTRDRYYPQSHTTLEI